MVDVYARYWERSTIHLLLKFHLCLIDSTSHKCDCCKPWVKGKRSKTNVDKYIQTNFFLINYVVGNPISLYRWMGSKTKAAYYIQNILYLVWWLNEIKQVLPEFLVRDGPQRPWLWSKPEWVVLFGFDTSYE